MTVKLLVADIQLRRKSGKGYPVILLILFKLGLKKSDVGEQWFSFCIFEVMWENVVNQIMLL